jgi:xylulokinase
LKVFVFYQKLFFLRSDFTKIVHIMAKYYLGLDCSTQSITALILEQKHDNDVASTRILTEKSLNFDATYPEFDTHNGVLPAASGLAHTPPQLWVRALEGVLEALKKEGVPLHEILSIGTSGQQHGSVYLNASAEPRLASLDPNRDLAGQLEGIYSRKTSPIWMDASTSLECREITKSLGGDEAVCRLTGSRCFERFTGPQIRKFHKTEPENYKATAHVCLVSSFIPSLLAGKIVPIDPGDGAGMNLMDIARRAWSPEALEATAPELAQKLLPIQESDSIAGTISSYFTTRFGFSPSCKILPGTGDNPSSLVGLGLVSGGAIGISLGTSDTVFSCMSSMHTDPDGASHVFGSPTGAYMAISVYKNGSLAREAVRNRHGLSWEAFSGLLKQTPPGNQGRVMLPYFDTEIIPRINKPGVQRYGFSEEEAGVEVRAVIEAQMASMILHSAWMGEKPVRIQATGGASNNREILQIMADMFGVPVMRQETSNSAALGAAIRAQHTALKVNREVSFEALARPHLRATFILNPEPGVYKAYQSFISTYRQMEADYFKISA